MRISSLAVAVLASFSLAFAQQPQPTDTSAATPEDQPIALTIYNQSFAVARAPLDLNLHAGMNEVTTTGVTSMLEPDSVVLRDPASHRVIPVYEQNYDAGVVNQAWLLEKYEGKTIDFQVNDNKIVQGRIIRAGGSEGQPLIEVNGKMQFQMPGLPLFPTGTDGLLLKPTLRWQIQSPSAQHLTAEMAYITSGLAWEATYNVVAPESTNVTADEKADVLGWITIHNTCGTDFPQARIKLMAGDVNKIQNVGMFDRAMAKNMAMAESVAVAAPQVTQKAFDDFHLYDLNRTVALRNGETKQVQFIDASGVTLRRIYSYDAVAGTYLSYYGGGINQNRAYGLDTGNKQVAIIQEFKNSEENHMGMPLPAGRVRLYRRDTDGQMEFVGESTIAHTPTDQTIKLPTGFAFDVKGSRRQTDFHISVNDHWIDEAFEVKITNQKAQPVRVNVVEHMYRGDNWQITEKSSNYSRLDSHTLQFPVDVPSKGETTLTYTVHYTW